MPVLYRASFRLPACGTPGSFGLALLGICIGVAVMVAVDLANDSSRKAFLLSMNAINGEATHQIVGGPRGIDENLYARLRVDEGVHNIAPVVDGFVEYNGVALRLLGIDVFAERNMRDHRLIAAPEVDQALTTAVAAPAAERIFRRILTEPGALLMSTSTAISLGLQIDDEFQIVVGGRPQKAVLVGMLSGAGKEPDNLLIADIGVAQYWFDEIGFLSRIDVRIASGDTEQVAGKIRSVLPPDVQLLNAADRTRSISEYEQCVHDQPDGDEPAGLVGRNFPYLQQRWFRRTAEARIDRRVAGIGD